MRTLVTTVIVLLGSVHAARAQSPGADFVHGRDYVFDRLEATRAVNDKQDQGTLRLVTYVYRPFKKDRREVVVFSIGSTGGMIRSPKEPGADFKQRLELQIPRLAKAAKQFTGPWIWIYAVRDPWYRDDAPRLLLDAWREAGGQADFVAITEHSLPNAHLALTDATLWGRQMAAFLERLDKSKN